MTSTTPFKPNSRSRMISRLASNRHIAWFFAQVLHLLDVPVMRWSSGRFSLTSLVTSLPILTLTTIGAKSGLPRTKPLVGIVEQDRIVLVASNFGQKKNPAWYYNLKANPEAKIMLDGEQQSYLAYEAEGAERESYWQKMVQIYSGYAVYKERASHRRIPVMVLDIKQN